MVPVSRSLEDLVSRAAALAGRGERTLLGITGAPGAGKSTLAESLVGRLTAGGVPAALVPMDGFHLAQDELERLGRADRKGAPDTFDAAGYAALLGRLRSVDRTADGTVYAPRFHRDVENAVAGSIPVGPDVTLVVTEGNYLLVWEPVRALLDEVWFCQVPEEVRLARLVARREGYGQPTEVARHWAYGSDQRNADVVAPSGVHADLLVRLASDP
jgi:pantothenate kinase